MCAITGALYAAFAAGCVGLLFVLAWVLGGFDWEILKYQPFLGRWHFFGLKPACPVYRAKKDPSAFLQGGAVDSANRTEPVIQSMVTKVHREQKVFRLPLDLINALKRESYERSVKTGLRVTETELVEQALRSMLSI